VLVLIFSSLVPSITFSVVSGVEHIYLRAILCYGS
jgi:hypothetical protein